MEIIDKKENEYLAVFKFIDFSKIYKYDERSKNYYDENVRNIRKNFILKYTSYDKCFDYGCGQNPLLIEYGVPSFDKYIEKYSNFDIKAFRKSKFLLLFDVLEHFYDPAQFLSIIPQDNVILTIPIFKDEIKDESSLYEWKHYKPGEHIWYWNEIGFKNYINKIGWEIVECCYNECPPRIDIQTYYIKRII
jgi:hypothetical protein